MRVAEIPIFLRHVVLGGAGFFTDFTLGLNGDPLSGYPGPWANTANQALGDNAATFTRGMESTTVGFQTPRRDSTLFNGTFTARIHTQAAGNDFANMSTRMTSAGNGGVLLVSHNGSVTWRIQIYDTSNTLQVDYDTTVAFSPGTTYNLKLVLSNTVVTGFINNVQVGVAQSDTWNTSSQTYMGYGINGNGTTLTTIENIGATP